MKKWIRETMRKCGVRTLAFLLAAAVSLSGAGTQGTSVVTAAAAQTQDDDQKSRDLEYLESYGVIIVEDHEAMKKDLIKRMRKHEKKMTYYYDEAEADYQAWVDSFLKGNEREQNRVYGEIGGMIREYDEYLAGNAYERGLGYMTYGDYYCVTFTFGYYTTKAQDQTVEKTAKKLAQKYKNKTTYEKIKLTHDYLKKKITYTNGYNGAYNAMIKGKSVCNGYALSFQRVMQEMGVDCKYVTGTGNGGGHAWNLVKLGKSWYNIDVTWDDTAQTNDYFLKSDQDFKDHVRDYEDQYRGLKIAAKSYKK